tara:strand:+ start:1398 stop:2372 length:975 start_codon:yes stop_codon:yes gene_type:complete
MINNVLNNTINSMSKLLAENKDKIIAAAKKRAEEELGDQIPTREDLEMQLQSIVASTLADPTGAVKSVPASNSEEFQKTLLEVEKVYNKSISLIDKVIKKSEDGKRELTSIKDKLSQITGKLDFLDKFTDPLSDIFNLISGIFITIDAGLAASSAVAANGGVINKLGELKKDLKDLVAKGKGSLDSISGIKNYFNKEVNKILDPLNKGISGFDKVLNTLGGPSSLENPPPGSIKAEIIDVYTKFIASLILPQLNDEDNDNELLGNENLLDYIKDKGNISTVLSDALIVTNKGGNTNNSTNNNTPNTPNSDVVFPPKISFKKFKQ